MGMVPAQSLPQLLEAVAQRQPDRPALWSKRNGRYQPTTYAQLQRQVAAFAAALQRHGVKAGERVAILAPNGPTWIVADFGAMLAGCVTVPVHTTFSPALIRFLVEHSGARVAVVSGPAMAEKLRAVAPPVPQLQHVVADTPLGTFWAATSVHDWAAWVEEGGVPRPVATRGSDLASIVYTSGTTGLPKGVCLTHGNFVTNVAASLQAVPLTPDDVLLSFLPLSHVLERTAGEFAPIAAGAQIAYAESPATLRENLREVLPTMLVAVPRVFEKFHDALWAKVRASPSFRQRLFRWALKQRRGTWQHRVVDYLVFRKVRAAFGGRLRLSISGGAALSTPLQKFFDRLGVLILEGYGLTETAPVVTVNTEAARRIGSVGRPVAGVSVRLASDKEVLVSGPNVCLGYWQDEASTRELIDRDGWLHTGDLGFQDADGYLFIIGRRKEMLVTAGGKNVWPQVLENAINGDPLVTQSIVIGNNRPYLTALVVPAWAELKSVAQAEGWPSSPAELTRDQRALSFFTERVQQAIADRPAWEQVRKIALLPTEFSAERDEVTPTQKLRRSVIERHYTKEISALYER